MQIAIVCVGRLKESYLRQAVAEYQKRLSRYAQTEMIEVDDEPAPERLSPAQREQVLQAEGVRLLAHCKERDYLCALCVDGARYTSPAFAAALEGIMAGGHTRLVFVIGGSLGLSAAVLQRANARISLSDMTLPHQLIRVVLLEQVYRAHKILRNEPYHK